MATTYKSPGVYVEEIPKLPQSVADVPTAIPGFVGYTAFASSNPDHSTPDLLKKPTKITSLLDYERLFGTGSTERKFVLYDSIRLFYDNGGGVCYIVSVGDYTQKTFGEELKNGLDPLRDIDEVTLLVVPDAATCLDEDGLAAVQAAALKQCGELQDRFAILDVQENGSKSIDDCLAIFRNKLSTNFPEYGAAYYPYLSTSYTYQSADFNDVVKKVVKERFTKDGEILCDELINATLENDKKSGIVEAFKGDVSSCITFLRALNDEKAFKTYMADKKNDDLKSIFSPLTVSFEKAKQIWNAPGDFGISIESKTLDETFENRFKAECDKPDFKDFVLTKLSPSEKYDNLAQDAKRAKGEDYLKKLVVEELIQNRIDKKTAKGEEEYLPTYLYALDPVMDAKQKKTAEDALKPFIPFYDVYEKEMAKDMSIVPPSGAIAGIYAQNDNFSGVWKAPANMAIASIKGLTRLINNQVQEDMNVTSSGKSVNAIRAFSGKGILVWGARTLKGNDNEWRYVPVRRLFNYVEESVQESTEWAVFAPNTQNTWTKIKCQIENFLTNIWRAGGLAGSTPAEAFYVNVGLGTTMDSVDILEGRLIVEIGMAAVRPAEFIILRFSHKLQES